MKALRYFALLLIAISIWFCLAPLAQAQEQCLPPLIEILTGSGNNFYTPIVRITNQNDPVNGVLNLTIQNSDGANGVCPIAPQVPITITGSQTITFEVGREGCCTCDALLTVTDACCGSSSTASFNSYSRPDNPLQRDISISSKIAGAACQIPTVQIQPFKLIPKGLSVFIQVTINPSPSNMPITLTLSRNDKKGKEPPSGKAIFKSNQSQQLEIKESALIEISAIDASSNENNIELKAIIKNSSSDIVLAEQPFSIVWVTLDIRTENIVGRKVEKISNDNRAKSVLQQFFNTDELGVRFINGSPKKEKHAWSTIVELTGKVMPSDYTGEIVLQRILKEKKTYTDMKLESTETNKPDTSEQDALDTDPQSGESKGIVYDVDAPGLVLLPTPNNRFGTIVRQRRNFVEFATTPDLVNPNGSFVIVSDVLPWFNRISVIKTQNSTNEFNNEIERSIPGDNQAGTGSTKTTADLK